MRKLGFVLAIVVIPLWAAGELSNRRSPGFSLPDSNIKRYDLADYRGKVVVLEFMQTKCPHCGPLADTLEAIAKKYAGQVQILSIVTTPPDDATTVGKFVKDHRVSYPILFDCGQAMGSYMKATPQNPSFDIPHVFLIDGDGVIRNDFGYSLLTREIFEGRGLFAEVEKLLAPAKK